MLQAVMMVAGKSTRCYPLTLTRPKPLLKVAGKTIIEHNLDALDGIADEAILITGYMGDMIKERLGAKYGRLKLRYVEQKEQQGTANAALQAEKLIKDRFIIMNGDDLFSREDIQEILGSKFAILASEVPDPQRYGVLETKKGVLAGIEEKPEKPKSFLINTGFYLVDASIFPIIRKLKPSPRGEYEITDAVVQFAKAHAVSVVKAKGWMPNGYSWDLLNTNEKLLARYTKSDIKGTVEPNVTIHGIVIAGPGTVMKSGTYIEGTVLMGANCEIGPNCYIRGSTCLGDNCKVGQAVEVKNSVIMDNTKISHLSYLGDSVVGDNVNFGAGTISANLRHEHDTVKSKLGETLIDTGRKKFGTIIGDNVHTGIHTSIYPGRKIWPGKITRPGDTVKEDIL